MSEQDREILLGDYTLSIKEHDNGFKEASLKSGQYGAQLELEKKPDNKIRIKELEFGSAEIPVEYLAMMLVFIGVDGELIEQIQKVKKARNSL